MSARSFLSGGNASDSARRVSLALRLAAGGTFAVFGIGKFVQHTTEVASFHDFGFSSAGALVYAIGVVEIGGGVLLLAGLATRVAALALAGNMVGAIATAGVKVGGPIHLGFAPALLIAMLFIVWAGPDSRSLDARMLRSGGERAGPGTRAG
ncbi:MAG TPA: DoxX family protein [Solirubrobacteraceae bacterium]